MQTLDHRYWPVWVAIVFLIAAAAVNSQTQVVPNWLTYSAVLGAWIAGVCVWRGLLPSAGGGIGPALLLSALGLALLLPFYAVGFLGAGCVKANMALGGWIGCAVGAERGAKWLIGGAAVGFLLAVGGWWASQQYGLTTAAASQMFPAQAAFSLGAILTLVVMLRKAYETPAPAAEDTGWKNSPAA